LKAKVQREKYRSSHSV